MGCFRSWSHCWDSAISAKEEAERLEGEIHSLRQRIFLSGGMTVDIAGVARNRAEAEAQVQSAKEALGEIDLSVCR